MWEKDRGILLGHVRHNDKSCIAHIFTEAGGYTSFIFYISDTGKGARRNTLLQPLTLIEFQCNPNGRDTALQHLREPVNIQPYTDIPFNPVKSCIALFLGEFLTYALREERENRPLFSFLAEVVNDIDRMPHTENAHLYIILKVSNYLGIGPNTDRYEPGYWLDMRDGTYSATQPQHTEVLDPDEAYKTVQLMKCDDIAQASEIPMTGSMRAGLVNMMNQYFRLHVPGFPILKSTEVMQAVFS